MVQRPKLKTYQAWTMSEALAFVKEDLGADAVILHTRTFDRGGFLGFGRRAVVEITAARAEDMPRRETPKAADESRRAAPSARVAEAPRGSGIDAARIGAAARAYAPTARTGAAGAPAADRANEVRDAVVGSVGSASGPRAANALHGAAAEGAPLDMDSEREKTRRLAQAMMVRLERESAERAAAAVNEQATLRAAERFGFRAREFQAPQQAAAPVFSTAQRFVLMPEPTVGASGAMRMTAALVRQPEPLPSIEDSLDDALASISKEAAATAPMPAAVDSAVTTAKPAAEPVAVQPAAAVPVSPSPAAVVSEPATMAPPTMALPTMAPSTMAPSTMAPSTMAPSTMAPSMSTPAGGDPVDRAAVRRPIVVEPVPAAAPAPARSRELDEISDFVGRVLSGGQGPSAVVAPAPAAVAPAAAPSRAPELETMYAQLIEQEVARELADRILREVEAELESDDMSPEAVRAAVERRIAALVPAIDGDAFRIVPGRHGPRRIAFVGPTGVGKTTTLAKIAAQLKLKRGLRVGIVAADTYRIAAVDQLRTYAEILGLPVEVASSPSDAARACADLADVDVILIDTAGRSQNDCMKISELRRFLASAQPDETHLVLSATAGMKTLEREAKAFGEVGVDRIVLTKLDEAAAFGTLVSLVERLGKQVSFLTHGQEVPDHIETARGTRLAALVLGSEVR